MSVEFTEEVNNNFNSEGNKGLTEWIIKKGIVKDKKGAEYIMIIISIICFVTMGLIFYQQNRPNTEQVTLTDEQIQKLPEAIRSHYE